MTFFKNTRKSMPQITSIITVFTLMLALVPNLVFATTDNNSAIAPIESGETSYIVVLNDNANPEAIANNLDLAEENDILADNGILVASELDDAQIKDLEKNPAVLFVEENFELFGNAIDDDSSVSDEDELDEEYTEPDVEEDEEDKAFWDNIQTYLDRTSIPVDEVEWNIQAVNVAEDVSEPSAFPEEVPHIRVAVLDSGVDIVRGINLADTVNLIPGEEEITPMFWDMSGHGTGIASIIAGNLENDVQGVNPNADLISVKVLDEENIAPVSRIIEGIYWCIENDIQIINMSFGTSRPSNALKKSVEDAYAAGILMVAAAGNASDAVEYPAAYPQVMAVAATGTDAKITDFSNTGDELDIAAPGENIMVASFFGGQMVTHGTSIAAPHVAGAASLLWQKDATKSADFIRQLLDFSAKNIENSNDCGLLDVDFALSIYDEFSVNWDGSGSVLATENTAEPEMFEEVNDDENYVEGRWSPANHANAAAGANPAPFAGISGDNLKALKFGAIFPDFKDIGLKNEFHGQAALRTGEGTPSVDTNYIALYIHLTKIAAKGGSVENLSPTKGFLSPVHVGSKKKGKYFDFKQRVENLFFSKDGGKIPPGISKVSVDGYGNPTLKKTTSWEKIFNYKNNKSGVIYKGQPSKKKKEIRSYFIYGIAIHGATDLFAHDAFARCNTSASPYPIHAYREVKKNGKTEKIYDDSKKEMAKRTGFDTNVKPKPIENTKQQVHFIAHPVKYDSNRGGVFDIIGADNPNVVESRYDAAKLVAEKIAQHAIKKEAGKATDFSSAYKNNNGNNTHKPYFKLKKYYTYAKACGITDTTLDSKIKYVSMVDEPTFEKDFIKRGKNKNKYKITIKGIDPDSISSSSGSSSSKTGEIRYTENGTKPNSGSILYNSAFYVNPGKKISAILRINGVNSASVELNVPEALISAEPTTTPTPATTPLPGTESSYVALKFSPVGDIVPEGYYYTTNGTEPNATSTNYATTTPILTSSGWVLARSYWHDNNNNTLQLGSICRFYVNVESSSVGGYPRTEKSLSSGTYKGAQDVSLSNTTGSTYYTTDGSNPINSTTRQIYTGSITIDHSLTLKSVNIVSGIPVEDDDISEEHYTIVNPPTFSLPAGTYSGTQQVSLGNLQGDTYYSTDYGQTWILYSSIDDEEDEDDDSDDDEDDGEDAEEYDDADESDDSDESDDYDDEDADDSDEDDEETVHNTIEIPAYTVLMVYNEVDGVQSDIATSTYGIIERKIGAFGAGFMTEVYEDPTKWNAVMPFMFPNTTLQADADGKKDLLELSENGHFIAVRESAVNAANWKNESQLADSVFMNTFNNGYVGAVVNQLKQGLTQACTTGETTINANWDTTTINPSAALSAPKLTITGGNATLNGAFPDLTELKIESYGGTQILGDYPNLEVITMSSWANLNLAGNFPALKSVVMPGGQLLLGTDTLGFAANDAKIINENGNITVFTAQNTNFSGCDVVTNAKIAIRGAGKTAPAATFAANGAFFGAGNTITLGDMHDENVQKWAQIPAFFSQSGVSIVNCDIKWLQGSFTTRNGTMVLSGSEIDVLRGFLFAQHGIDGNQTTAKEGVYVEGNAFNLPPGLGNENYQPNGGTLGVIHNVKYTEMPAKFNMIPDGDTFMTAVTQTNTGGTWQTVYGLGVELDVDNLVVVDEDDDSDEDGSEDDEEDDSGDEEEYDEDA